MNTDELSDNFIKSLWNRGLTFIADEDNEVRAVLKETVINPMLVRMAEIMGDCSENVRKIGGYSFGLVTQFNSVCEFYKVNVLEGYDPAFEDGWTDREIDKMVEALT